MSKYLVGADCFEQANYNDNARFFREAMAKLEYIEFRHINPQEET